MAGSAVLLLCVAVLGQDIACMGRVVAGLLCGVRSVFTGEKLTPARCNTAEKD